MLHDISHCNADKCELKDTCYRYQAHLEAQEKKLDYLCYFVNNDKRELGVNCTAYWFHQR